MQTLELPLEMKFKSKSQELLNEELNNWISKSKNSPKITKVEFQKYELIKDRSISQDIKNKELLKYMRSQYDEFFHRGELAYLIEELDLKVITDIFKKSDLKVKIEKQSKPRIKKKQYSLTEKLTKELGFNPENVLLEKSLLYKMIEKETKADKKNSLNIVRSSEYYKTLELDKSNKYFRFKEKTIKELINYIKASLS